MRGSELVGADVVDEFGGVWGDEEIGVRFDAFGDGAGA